MLAWSDGRESCGPLTQQGNNPEADFRQVVSHSLNHATHPLSSWQGRRVGPAHSLSTAGARIRASGSFQEAYMGAWAGEWVGGWEWQGVQIE